MSDKIGETIYRGPGGVPALVIDGKTHLPTYAPGMLVALPRVGDVIVRRIHPLGTVDVESVATGNWFRVSGLTGSNWEARS